MDYKSGFVTLVGRPNVGKSTLLNILTGEKIAITSSKPQTTRNTIRSVLTENSSQIIFLDTPGIHSPKTKLGEFMVSKATSSIGEVDIVLFLIDANDKRVTSANLELVERLKLIKKPVFLIINKIDSVEKEKLIPLISSYSSLMGFKAIIPVSALKNDGVSSIIKEIKNYLPKGPQYFPDDTLTDQPEKVIVSEMIREKLLNFMNDEIPHGTGVEVMSFKERQDKAIIDISATIYCEKKSHKAMIIGKQGKMLKRIGSSARKDIEGLLDSKVFLELWIKVKEDWRNQNNMLKNLGYDK